MKIDRLWLTLWAIFCLLLGFAAGFTVMASRCMAQRQELAKAYDGQAGRDAEYARHERASERQYEYGARTYRLSVLTELLAQLHAGCAHGQSRAEEDVLQEIKRINAQDQGWPARKARTLIFP